MQGGKNLAFEGKYCLRLQGQRKNVRKVLRNCGKVPVRKGQRVISGNNKLQRHLHENLKSVTTLYVIRVVELGFNVTMVKVKVKVTLVQALRLCIGRTAHRESIGIALPFHDHGTRRE